MTLENRVAREIERDYYLFPLSSSLKKRIEYIEMGEEKKKRNLYIEL